MNNFIKYMIVGVLVVGVVGGMIYKVQNPTPYKHPLRR